VRPETCLGADQCETGRRHRRADFIPDGAIFAALCGRRGSRGETGANGPGKDELANAASASAGPPRALPNNPHTTALGGMLPVRFELGPKTGRPV
jgi:hypothetical protein